MSRTLAALEAARWTAGLWLLWSVRRPRSAIPPGPGLAGVSVVVPARDEAGTLPTLLGSLGAGTVEVLVVDDDSSDGTADVARRYGASVVAAPPLPAGWTGKSWACWTGAAATAGDVLVFLDADTELAPGGLDRIVAEHRARGGLLSVQPFHRTVRPYESLSALFNVVSVMGVGAATPTAGRRTPTGAFGPCLATSRADYDAVGGHGHGTVRAAVVEDVALARRYAATGRPVACLGGRGTIDFRMYPGGPGQLVEGWSKNFAAGAGATRPLTFALVSLWLSGCISAAWYAGTALAGAGPLGGPAAGVVYLAYAGQLQWMLVRLGRFRWWTAPAYPVPLVFFLAVFARSLVLTHLRGEVRWRGRDVPTRGR